MKDKKVFIKSQYNKTADKYEERYSKIQKRKFKELNHIKVESPIIDVGCGTALILKTTPLKNKQYVGLDISEEMLKIAKTKKHSFTDFIIADAENLPLNEEIANTVLAFTIIQNLPDCQKAIHEIKRVKKTTGYAVISALKKLLDEEKFRKEIKKAKMEIKEKILLEDSEDNIYILK